MISQQMRMSDFAVNYDFRATILWEYGREIRIHIKFADKFRGIGQSSSLHLLANDITRKLVVSFAILRARNGGINVTYARFNADERIESIVRSFEIQVDDAFVHGTK